MNIRTSFACTYSYVYLILSDRLLPVFIICACQDTCTLHAAQLSCPRDWPRRAYDNKTSNSSYRSSPSELVRCPCILITMVFRASKKCFSGQGHPPFDMLCKVNETAVVQRASLSEIDVHFTTMLQLPLPPNADAKAIYKLPVVGSPY